MVTLTARGQQLESIFLRNDKANILYTVSFLSLTPTRTCAHTHPTENCNLPASVCLSCGFGRDFCCPLFTAVLRVPCTVLGTEQVLGKQPPNERRKVWTPSCCVRASVGAAGPASPLARWARAPRAGRAEGRGLRSPPSLRSVVRGAAVQTPTVGSGLRLTWRGGRFSSLIFAPLIFSCLFGEESD